MERAHHVPFAGPHAQVLFRETFIVKLLAPTRLIGGREIGEHTSHAIFLLFTRAVPEAEGAS